MRRMLVVEDDNLSQDLMKRIFKNEYELDICESSEEYYKKYSKIIYSIIIMDVALKGDKHGIELIREIRECPSQKRIPIICLSAHAHAVTRKNALDSGADVFFAKPVHNSRLKEAVTSLLRQ